MWNTPTPKRLAKIPAIGTSANTEIKNIKIFLHFFVGGCDWYVAEFDGKDTFFGFVILNNDEVNAEWGYFSFSELQKLKQGFAQVDCERVTYFPIQKVEKIDRIANILRRRANG